jgi:CHAD domain-containing protein
VAPALRSPLDSVLAAAGRQPCGYSSKIDVKLTGAMPARSAMQKVLLRLLGTLEANVPGTVRDIDTEFLHDLRVAVRRTRSGIKLCGDVLAAGTAEAFRGEFKWLGDVTTPIRDLDVYLLGYDGMAAGLLSATPAELAPFHHYLCQRREIEQRALARALRSRRFLDMTRAWRGALAAPAPRRGMTAARLAADRIRRADRQVLRRGTAITPDSPPESLHDLRKRCKELRYLLEFFAPLHDQVAYRKVLSDLKQLQDCLGEFQDSEVQRAEIHTLADAMLADSMLAGRAAPAATLLAMGEIAAKLALSQAEARAEFSARFARFAGPVGRERVQVLLEGRS